MTMIEQVLTILGLLYIVIGVLCFLGWLSEPYLDGRKLFSIALFWPLYIIKWIGLAFLEVFK